MHMLCSILHYPASLDIEQYFVLNTPDIFVVVIIIITTIIIVLIFLK